MIVNMIRLACFHSSVHRTAILWISKMRQIGTLRDYIHFEIIVYGNSSFVFVHFFH